MSRITSFVKLSRITLLFLITHISLVSQNYVNNARKGYYIVDSTKFEGIYIENQDANKNWNQIVIPEQNLHKYTIFKPFDIAEFGYENGEKHISATILLDGENCSVFLEEMIRINDSIGIYSYDDGNKEYLFIKKSNRFIQAQTEYGTEIWDYIKKNAPQDAQSNIDYPSDVNRNTILKYYYALCKKNTKFYMRYKWGAIVDLGTIKPSNNQDFISSYNWGIINSLGLFIEIPFATSISIQPEAFFSTFTTKKELTDNSITSSNNENLNDLKKSSLRFNLICRYYFNEVNGRFTPFMEVGPTLDNTFSSNRYFTTYKNREEISTNKITELGGIFGFGINCNLNSKQSISSSIRFAHLSGNINHEIKTSSEIFSLFTSINF